MAVFTPAPLQIPNMRTDYSAQNQAFANLGQTLGNLPSEMRKEQLNAQKQQALLGLGQDIKAGNFSDAAGKAFALGDTQGAVGLLGLQQKKMERDSEKAWLGGGTTLGSAPASTAGIAPASLIQNESGGNWGASNNVVGAGGQVGHDGRAQFSRARLQDAANAGAIPQGVSREAFRNSPELQKKAEAWHFGDIDNFIQANGYDKMIGQSINGVPVTVDGMRAVAHLGGTGGLRKFLETGGQYNPSDRNGTSLMDYFTRHGGNSTPLAPRTQIANPVAQPQQPVQVAKNEADVQRLEQAQAQAPDMPAPGAANAQGFAVPGAENEYQQRSILSDKTVQHWQNRLNTAPTDRTRAIAQSNLNLAIKDAEQRFAEGKSSEAVREFREARKNGWTQARTPIEYAKEKADATRATKTASQEVEQRKEAAAAAGIPPSDPRYQTYILTGKTPREDAQPLTATDKKAILEADEAIASGETALRALNEAKGLSKQAMSGPFAGIRAKLGNNVADSFLPDWIASPQGAEATANLENTVTANALSQMKAIFGGNPTEGERKILLDIQGSINQPDNVRQGIYDRAIRAAEARLAFNRQRAEELRGNTYYKPQAGSPGGAGQGAAPTPQPAQQERQAASPPSNAKQASDGKFYLPDPDRPGKYLMWQP